MKRLPLCALIIASLSGQLGCASSEEDRGPAWLAAVESVSLMPWNEGNRWTYRVTEGGKEGTKEVTVGPEETIGGSGPHSAQKANRVVTKKDDGAQTISWQIREGERLVRYREYEIKAGSTKPSGEEHWDPARLHVDDGAAHTAAGATWIEKYAETKISKSGTAATSNEQDTWTVEAVDESVTVPAGTFRAIVLQKAGGGTPKKYWYVRGIGKVKETGGQTEELVSYQLTP